MNKNRVLGAWMGAAIGDAMGGPVEAQHYKSIIKKAGYVDRLLPYDIEKYSIFTLKPGYAIHGEPGSITDDTYIRADLARYFLDKPQPWTAEDLCKDIQARADFSYWWPVALDALDRVKEGMSPEESGKIHAQGGGNGWWYPVAMLYPGQPEKAAAVVRELSLPWKSGLEKDLLGALVGTMSYALGDQADYKGCIKTALDLCEGSLSHKLIERAVEIGESAEDWQDLCKKAYARLLIHEEATRDMNGSLPPEIPAVDITDEIYISVLFTEQMPLMFAGFAFARGEINSICATVTLGRDCDSTATAVGFLTGALKGLKALPKEWVQAVQESNLLELDLLKMGEDLFELSLTL